MHSVLGVVGAAGGGGALQLQLLGTQTVGSDGGKGLLAWRYGGQNADEVRLRQERLMADLRLRK